MKEQIYDTHYIVLGKLDSAQRLEGKITCALKEMYWLEGKIVLQSRYSGGNQDLTQ